MNTLKRLFKLRVTPPKEKGFKYQDIVVPIKESDLKYYTATQGSGFIPIYLNGFANRDDAIAAISCTAYEEKYYMLSVKEVLTIKPRPVEIMSNYE